MKEKAIIAKGTVWSLVSGILTKLISFIYTVLIARLVVKEEVGAFYLVLSILGILYIFTDLGIVYYLNRFVPFLYGKGETGRLKGLIGLSYFGAGGLTFLFSIGVFFLSGFISETEEL